MPWRNEGGKQATPLIAPLLLIPFVENSFKHGASKMISNPYINLRVTVEDDVLYFFLINNKPGTLQCSAGADNDDLHINGNPSGGNGSIGLNNVKKRLQLLYPGAHELNIISGPASFNVYLKINMKEIALESNKEGYRKQITDHEMA
jgi:LytS/YehU family sensor histidine kinase